jgi:hypothetical protein
VSAQIWWGVIAEENLAPGVAGQCRDNAGDRQAVRGVRVSGVEDALPGSLRYHLDERGDVDSRRRMVGALSSAGE